MPATIKQTVTVKPGGVVEIRSPELQEGDVAEVTVVVGQPPAPSELTSQARDWRRFAGIFKGDPNTGDNRRVDAELAKEYGSSPKSED
jgi:hypothetical protein